MIKTRLIGLVPNSKKYIAINVALQWIGLVCNIAMIVVIARLLDGMRRGNSLPILLVTAVLISTIIIRVLCVKFAAKASYKASSNVKRTLRGMIYEKLLSLGTSYRKQASTAEIVQLAGEGVEQLETYFGSYLPQFFYAILAPLTLFAVFGCISIKIAVILIICVPLIPISIVIVQKIAMRLLANYWGQYASLGDDFLENLQGLTTLKVYGADEQRHREMNAQAEHFRKITMKVLSMQLNSIIIMDIIAYGGAALAIFFAVEEMNSGNIGFEGCFIVIMLSVDFFLPLRQLGSYFHVAMNGMAASDKIFDLLDIEEETGRNEIPEGNDIELNDLSFGYSGERQVLHQINMKFSATGLTAIVGESGCGKSTIASILTGRHTDYSGNVLFGGKELKRVREDELMRHIVLISHNSYIFKGTVRENLLMGKVDAKDSELWYILEKVRLADFIRSEGGLDMWIQEGASNLSGGQRQRLALGRALLHDAPIFVFDEATSNIDVESENDIMKLIYELARIKKVVLISHRLANTATADFIYVLEKGRVVQSGRHDELLKEEGIYRKLWEEQQELEREARIS